MAREIPTTEPSTLYAGDTVQWTKTFSDYPKSDGWSLAYSFRGPTALATATAAVNPSDAAGYLITIAASDTVLLSAGVYRWTAKVTKGAEVYTVGRGTVAVELTAGAAVTSHAESMVTLLEAAIAGRIAGDVQSYTIGGRTVEKIPIGELRGMLAQYRHQAWKKKNPGRSGPTRKVTFGVTD